MALYHSEEERPRLTFPTIRLDGAVKEPGAAEGASYWTGKLGMCRQTAQGEVRIRVSNSNLVIPDTAELTGRAIQVQETEQGRAVQGRSSCPRCVLGPRCSPDAHVALHENRCLAAGSPPSPALARTP